MTTATDDAIIGFIVSSFRHCDITIGEALEMVIRHPVLSDDGKWRAVGHITKAQLELEAPEPWTNEDGLTLEDLRHGPHGKRCFCSECTEAEYLADQQDREENT